MSEQRTPYRTPQAGRYAGTRLEQLVEALDDLREFAPAGYITEVAQAHRILRDMLEGRLEPVEGLTKLLSKPS